jgi:hypothetical protein
MSAPFDQIIGMTKMRVSGGLSTGARGGKKYRYNKTQFPQLALLGISA